MKKRNTENRTKNLLSTVLALVLTLSLVAGVLAVDPANAASEFTYPSPFSNVGNSTYYHNGRFAGNLIVNGVDISDWQSKNCNFASARAAGVDFSIMRVTWTSYGKSDLVLHNDDNFASQYANAKANGVMCGVYVFSQALNAAEGAKEAANAIKRLQELGIGPKDLALPVYMDYEFAGGVLGRMHGISSKAATNAAVAFCNTIQAAGYTPGIYANTSFFGSYIATGQFSPEVDFWCAQYYKKNQSAVNYSKWQYSSSAKIDGMLSYLGTKGKIDVNFWYLNQNPATSPVVTKITGKTVLSAAEAVAPKFKLYNGNTLLREGVDYMVGGIRTNTVGNGYVYIKGIGIYGGYALIPVRIDAASAGSDDQEISCANYLRGASGVFSAYLDVPAVTVKATKIKKLTGKKKKFYVKVQKKSKANTSGYEVRYSRNKDMSDSVIKNIGKKYTKVSKNITTNARKMYYYVQVRAYKDSDGTRFYSSWSKTKKVWVK